MSAPSQVILQALQQLPQAPQFTLEQLECVEQHASLQHPLLQQFLHALPILGYENYISAHDMQEYEQLKTNGLVIENEQELDELIKKYGLDDDDEEKNKLAYDHSAHTHGRNAGA